MTQETISKLQQIPGLTVLTGEQIGADFCHDELPGAEAHAPEAVCEASSTRQVSEVLKVCSADRVPVTVRGAGTGRAGGSVPIRGGVVLSVRGMNSICSVDEEARTMTVQPGVLLQDVKAEAGKHGLFYPPDPGEKTATIGGNISTNASGPSAGKYGRTADYVIDAELVLADGTVTTLRADEANAAAAGSEGVLAVITQATLRLIEAPKADVILLLPFADSETAFAAARKLLDSDFDPAVVEYMDGELIEFSGKVTGNPVFPLESDGVPAAATLMVTLEGESEDAVEERMEEFAEFAEELECLDILVGDSLSMKREIWSAHDAFHTSMESAKSEVEVNVNVPAEHIYELLSFAKALGEQGGYKVMAYSHVSCGGVHIHAVSELPKSEFKARAAAFCDAVCTKCVELGGDAAGEYGVGYANLRYFKDSGERYAKLREAKAKLDPAGILNPGKVVELC